MPAAPLLLAATALSAVGTGVFAIQASNQAKYQARVATRNAGLEAQRAAAAVERGKAENLQLGRKYGALRGEQVASMAANGIDVDFGSAAALTAGTAMFQREDQQALFKNSVAEIQGIDISASNMRAEAAASRSAATGALVGGAFGVGTTILGGATQYAALKAKLGPTKLPYDMTGL